MGARARRFALELASRLAPRRALLALLLGATTMAQAATWTVGLVSLDDDPRYERRALEKGYPGHPQGRLIDAAQVAADESAIELEVEGHKLRLQEATAGGAEGLTRAFQELKKAQVRHVLLDLPAALLPRAADLAAKTLGGVVLFNVSAGADELRAKGCRADLLHTYPSEQMLADALAQYLAARNWRKALVLQGPLPGDREQLDAFQRAAKRYGVKINQIKPFKLSGDPRERDLGNPRLLTNDRDHDVVAVMDSDGEFARTLPYATQQPRPVVGANGLSALAWHPHWERNGAPQLIRRFHKAAQRPMTGQDWAAWAAVKAVAAVLVAAPKADVKEQLRLLRGGKVYVDGFKGPRLSFRPWDGQLRQPIFLTHGDGVVAVAPVDGVLHPTEIMDTLGVDERESACKARP